MSGSAGGNVDQGSGGDKSANNPGGVDTGNGHGARSDSGSGEGDPSKVKAASGSGSAQSPVVGGSHSQPPQQQQSTRQGPQPKGSFLTLRNSLLLGLGGLAVLTAAKKFLDNQHTQRQRSKELRKLEEKEERRIESDNERGVSKGTLLL